MEYMGNTTWWDARFQNRALKIMAHESYLDKDVNYFAGKQKVLDLACGDGRNAVYFAQNGYQVTAVDFSKEALKRLNYFKEQQQLSMKTQLVDLSDNDALKEIDGKYDIILINHYRPLPQIYQGLMELLNADGILWVNGFFEIPGDNAAITERDLLRDSDFASLSEEQLVSKEIYGVGVRKFVRYIWRK